jgi:hypothetical protein
LLPALHLQECRRMQRIFLAAGVGFIFSVAAICNLAAAESKEGVEIIETEKGARVTIDGKLLTEYICRGLSRPALYPLLGPGQSPMTRAWPFESPSGEEHDHPHHLSVWFAHGDINGMDFWSQAAGAGKTVHVKFLKIESGKHSGLIRTTNMLVSAQGKTIATDERTLKFYSAGPGRFFDYEVTMFASEGDLAFGDTKEGTMGIRIAESMRLMRNKKPAEGHIVLSSGARDGDAWGKKAEWCEYHGPVNGKIMGIAMFDHPENLRHPTTWHVRDYGLLAANPFGLHEFEKAPEGAGKYTLSKGKSLKFRYRIYLHEGDEKTAAVHRHYDEYKSGKEPKADSQ